MENAKQSADIPETRVDKGLTVLDGVDDDDFETVGR